MTEPSTEANSEAKPTRDEIVAAASALSARCDGAHEQDGQGYNGMDSVVAKSILRSKVHTDRQIRALWNILRKYHKQLSGLGFEYVQLVPPPVPSAGDDRRVYQDRGLVAPPPKREGVFLDVSKTPYGDRVTLQFEYDKRLVGLVQGLPKRWFDKDGKTVGKENCWSIPADLQSIQGALSIFKDSKVELSEKVQAILGSAERAYAESRSSAADFHVPTKLPLRPFQSAGVKWIDDRNGRALVADEMGLGKTPEALGWTLLRRETALPALVLVPATLRGNWINETAKFTDFKCLLMCGKSSLRSFKKLGEKMGFDVSDGPLPGYDLTILNYDLLSAETAKTWIKMLIKDEQVPYATAELVTAGKAAIPPLEKAMAKAAGIEIRNRLWKAITEINALGDSARGARAPRHIQAFVNGIPLAQFMKMGYQTLVSDESHYCKDLDAQRSMAALALSKLVKHSICLTGTPIKNRPMEIWSQTQMVDPKLFPKRFDFGTKFCNGHQTRFGWDFSGSSNLEELDRALRSSILIRRTKDQVLTELPEKTRVTVPFIIDESLEKKYRKEAEPAIERVVRMKASRDEWKALMGSMSVADQRKHVAEHAEQASRSQKLRGMMVADLEKIKQAALDVKLDQVIRFILDTQEQAGKVLVYATHYSTIDRIAAALAKEGLKTGVIDGRVDAAKRDPIKDAFQDGDTDVLVCGIRAASEGLTLTSSHTVMFAEFDWNPAQHDQAEARAHRMGQKNAVTIYYLVALGTIEEKIVAMIDSKREVVNAVLGETDRTLDEDGILDAVLESLGAAA